MAVDFKSHTEPKPAPEAEKKQMEMHAGIVHDLPPVPAPNTEELLEVADARVHAALVPYEGCAMDGNRIEALRRTLCDITHVATVGISVDEGHACVDVRLTLHGTESWIHAEFAARAMPSIVEPEVDEKAPPVRSAGPANVVAPPMMRSKPVVEKKD